MRWFEKQKIITVGLVLLIHLIGGSGFTGVWASVIPPSTSNGEGDAKIALNSNQTESSKLSASAGTSTTNAVKIQVLRIPDRSKRLIFYFKFATVFKFKLFRSINLCYSSCQLH